MSHWKLKKLLYFAKNVHFGSFQDPLTHIFNYPRWLAARHHEENGKSSRHFGYIARKRRSYKVTSSRTKKRTVPNFHLPRPSSRLTKASSRPNFWYLFQDNQRWFLQMLSVIIWSSKAIHNEFDIFIYLVKMIWRLFQEIRYPNEENKCGHFLEHGNTERKLPISGNLYHWSQLSADVILIDCSLDTVCIW